jgi:eukaryotic-like serine/threonine-protein kinase
MRLKRDTDSGRSATMSSSSSIAVVQNDFPGPAQSQSQSQSRTRIAPVTAAASVASAIAISAPTSPGKQLHSRSKLYLPIAAVLLLSAIGGLFYWRKHQAPKLTDKDQLILADFTNETGDPVFDSTLKEALAIQLEQSPVLQLVSDAELHSNLQYLGQSRAQKITPELAQQLGQRLGVKAYLVGAIASLGSSYVISINGVNCSTGEVFAREQISAPDKTGVLKAVSEAATAMRARLGESMASIQKLSTPYTNVTTTSLEAFHAFSLGEEEHRMGHDLPQAESFFQQAIQLDPSFAMAYARLGVVYGNQGALSKSVEYMKKAYDLRERVTERERMYIESEFAIQQFDLPKALLAFKLFVATYPRDAAAWNNMATTYLSLGDLEQAAIDFGKAWEIAKWNNVAANNAAGALIAIDRPQEAEHYLKDALEPTTSGTSPRKKRCSSIFPTPPEACMPLRPCTTLWFRIASRRAIPRIAAWPSINHWPRFPTLLWPSLYAARPLLSLNPYRS